MLPWFTKYPNQNDEILNLDWVIRQVENLKAAYEAFLAANSLTFADPILWDITKQYSKNTIVLSPEGDAYLSKKVVGVGVQLNNTDYWLEIFNFAEYVRTANSNLTMHIEQNTTRATDAYAVNDWLLWDDVLYKVTAAIAEDDLLTVGTNIVHFTVEDFCRTWQTYMVNTIAQYKADIDASELAYKQQLDQTVLQYKNDIDASEASYKADLAHDISSTTASLQAQLNAAIAGATVDSEVINIRVGANGITYPTAGDAVRGQFSDLKSAITEAEEPTRNLFKRRFGVFNGVTFSDTHDGGVHIQGTCNESGSFSVPINAISGHLALSYKCNNTYNADEIYIRCNSENAIQINGTPRSTSYTYTADVSDSTPVVKCGITIINGVTYNDTFYIQLEQGTESTEFIPNISCPDFVFREEQGEMNDELSEQIRQKASTEAVESNTAYFRQRMFNYGHQFKTPKQIYDDLKYSAIDYANVVSYSNESWTYGTESTLDGEISRYLQSTGNTAGMIVQYADADRKDIKNYIALLIEVEGAEYLTSAKIVLKQVVGGGYNAQFDLEDNLHEGMNVIILNRLDASSNTVIAWDWIRQIVYEITGTSGHTTKVNFGKIYTFNMKPLVSITFDDGHITHYTNAFAYTKTLNPPIYCSDAIITDNINVGLHLTDKDLHDLVANGWDLQSHTKNHKTFTTITEDEIRFQIAKAKEYLLGVHAGMSSFHLVPPQYARNATSEKIVKELCTVQKLCDDKFNNLPVLDPYAIQSFEVKVDDEVSDLTDKIDYAITHNLWVVFTFHMIMDSGIYQSFAIDKFKAVCDYIQTNRASIEPCTFTQAFYRM